VDWLDSAEDSLENSENSGGDSAEDSVENPERSVEAISCSSSVEPVDWVVLSVVLSANPIGVVVDSLLVLPMD